MDADARANYNAQLEAALADEEDGYTGEPLSKWMPTCNPKMAKNENPAEDRAVFVVSAGCGCWGAAVGVGAVGGGSRVVGGGWGVLGGCS